MAHEEIRSPMEVCRRYIREPFPATTAIVVAGSANPEWVIEIEATVALP